MENQQQQTLDLNTFTIDQLKDFIIDSKLQENIARNNGDIALSILVKKVQESLQPKQSQQQTINLPKLKKINLPQFNNKEDFNYSVNESK